MKFCFEGGALVPQRNFNPGSFCFTEELHLNFAYYFLVSIGKEVIYADECIHLSAVNYGPNKEPPFKALKCITALLKNNTYFAFKCTHAVLLK